MTDTIVAQATPTGRSGVGIVRVSGRDALRQTIKLWRGAAPNQIKPHYLHLGWLYDGSTPIDQAMLVYMPQPHSYTGEDVVEIHTHGSPPVMEWLIGRLIARGVRQAEAGEFTKRAYLNGKIDIAQAQAVNDLIHAASLAAAKQATDQLAGGLDKNIVRLCDELVQISAAETAQLDFGEEDIQPKNPTELIQRLESVRRSIAPLLKRAKTTQLLREGVRVAIVGLPNAGKSTLLNHLLQYDRSIVTEIAGTTRDHVEEAIVLDGIPMRLIDTAGLRDATGRVEALGIDRAHEVLSSADLKLLLIAPAQTSATEQYLKKHHISSDLTPADTIVIFTKSDIPGGKNVVQKTYERYDRISLSAKTGHNIDMLEDQLVKKAKGQERSSSTTQATLRQTTLLQAADQNISSAIGLLSGDQPRDVVLVEIDSAIEALNELRGADISQAKLDAMFANFCIGK